MFVELYEQVASKLTETRQYYTSYNTLNDTKSFLTKEVSILNSIHDGYKTAMSSKSGKETLLKSLGDIIVSVQNIADKTDTKLTGEKENQKQNVHKIC